MPMNLSRNERWVLEEKYGGKPAPGFEEDRRRLAAGEPAAYVIGHVPFLGLTIALASRPLIPRPETEWWTNELLEAVSKDVPLVFLDLCAGSGAIGCAALARLPKAQVYFGEIDRTHEAVIRQNIRRNGLDETRAHVGIGNLFEPFGNIRFDVVAANPPYVPQNRALDRSVMNFEPHAALFSGPDGLALLREIARELPRHLAPHAQAWIECDSAHAREARELFEMSGVNATISPDQHGAPRILMVR